MRGLGRAQSGVAALSLLTGLNVMNYTDRYIGAAVLPLILTSLALTDAQGGLLQSVFGRPRARFAGDCRTDRSRRAV